MLSITSTQQTQLINMYVGLFGKAPSSATLHLLANGLIAAGGNFYQYTKTLENDLAFASQFATKTTAESKAAAIAANFGMTDITTTTGAGYHTYQWIKAQISAGNLNTAEIGSVLGEFLRTQTHLKTDAVWSNTAKLMENKTAAAEHYAVTLKGTTDSASFIANVTSDAATVTTAINAPAVAAAAAAAAAATAAAATAAAAAFTLTEATNTVTLTGSSTDAFAYTLGGAATRAGNAVTASSGSLTNGTGFVGTGYASGTVAITTSTASASVAGASSIIATNMTDGNTLTTSGARATTITGLSADLTDTSTAAQNITVASVATITLGLGTDTTGTDAITATALTDGQILTMTGSNDATVSLVAGDLTANTYAGALTVTATTGTNVITTGSGINNITGGAGVDTINISASSAAVDTLNYAAGDSVGTGYDTVTGFNAAATNADILNLVATAKQTAATAGTGSAAEDVTVGAVVIGQQIVSAGGIVTFQAADDTTAVNLTTTDGVTAAVTYLSSSIANGSTVAFGFDFGGGNAGTVVFQGEATGDTVIILAGVTGITDLATVAGANTIVLA